MISIKRFLDRTGQPVADEGLAEAALRLQQLLLPTIEAAGRWNPEAATPDFLMVLEELRSVVEEEPSTLALIKITNELFAVLPEHWERTNANFREQNRQMQSMVAMLAATVAEISAQSDASVGTLQDVERKIEQASNLNDIRALKESLASCLAAVKEASVEQRNATLATVERLHEYIKRSPNPAPAEATPEPLQKNAGRGKAEGEYVASFKLQRADHIRSRFGDAAIEHMLDAMGEGLKAAQRPNDRLMRWKGTSFLMFINTSEDLRTVRQRLSRVILGIAQRYVEVGMRSALLAVGVDWIVLPQAPGTSPDSLFREVDSFLNEK